MGILKKIMGFNDEAENRDTAKASAPDGALNAAAAEEKEEATAVAKEDAASAGTEEAPVEKPPVRHSFLSQLRDDPLADISFSFGKAESASEKAGSEENANSAEVEGSEEAAGAEKTAKSEGENDSSWNAGEEGTGSFAKEPADEADSKEENFSESDDWTYAEDEENSDGAVNGTKPFPSEADKKPEWNNMDFLGRKKDEEERGEEAAERRYIDLILDRTISMSEYYEYLYPALISLLEATLRAAGDKQMKYGGMEVLLGLTFIQDEEPESHTFSGSGDFSSDGNEIALALKNVSFSGGREDGREDINAAVRLSLKKLKSAAEGEKDTCALLLFTDTLPVVDEEEEGLEMTPDFYDEVPLQAARLYLYDNEYAPLFNKVSFEAADNTVTRSLADFLNADTDRAALQLAAELLS